MKNLPLFIAFRYLFAKKTHNVINIISIISAVGICIGSLALTVILSVFNGFDNLITEMYESYEADFIISPKTGKTFILESNTLDKIESIEGVKSVFPVIEENIFIKYGNYQSIGQIKGVDTSYHNFGSLAKNIIQGEFKIVKNGEPHAIIGQQLAYQLQLRVKSASPLELYFPKRDQQISLINPMESLNSKEVKPSGIISLNQEIDTKIVFVPIETAAELIDYQKDEATSAEIYLTVSPKQGRSEMGYNSFYSRIERELTTILGDNFIVKDRYMQNETVYKMMKGEKLSIYIIMFFVIFIIAINIFSSLVMLIIDKADDMRTLTHLGASKSMIKRIFTLQGTLISVIGGGIGIIIGLIICYAQIYFELVRMPGNFFSLTYPIDVKFIDIATIYALVILIGIGISWAATTASSGRRGD